MFLDILNYGGWIEEWVVVKYGVGGCIVEIVLGEMWCIYRGLRDDC